MPRRDLWPRLLFTDAQQESPPTPIRLSTHQAESTRGCIASRTSSRWTRGGALLRLLRGLVCHVARSGSRQYTSLRCTSLALGAPAALYLVDKCGFAVPRALDDDGHADPGTCCFRTLTATHNRPWNSSGARRLEAFSLLGATLGRTGRLVGCEGSIYRRASVTCRFLSPAS